MRAFLLAAMLGAARVQGAVVVGGRASVPGSGAAPIPIEAQGGVASLDLTLAPAPDGSLLRISDAALPASLPIPIPPTAQGAEPVLLSPPMAAASALVPALPSREPGALVPALSVREEAVPAGNPSLGEVREALDHAPPASASAEEASGHMRGVVDLITGEKVRPASTADPAPIFSPTDTSLVRVADLSGALRALRAASYPRHESSDGLLAKVLKRHPELPLDPERVFLVKDRDVLAQFGLPPYAGGAARILTDGKKEEKIVILSGVKGVELDDFIEFSIHESIHLKDDGILRLPHHRILEHWLAEGYTQLRAHRMANEVLHEMGRPIRSNGAYSTETDLVRRMIQLFGEAPFKELVETGNTGGLARALGPRWEGLTSVVAVSHDRVEADRYRFLRIVSAVVEDPASFSPEVFAALAQSF